MVAFEDEDDEEAVREVDSGDVKSVIGAIGFAALLVWNGKHRAAAVGFLALLWLGGTAWRPESAARTDATSTSRWRHSGCSTSGQVRMEDGVGCPGSGRHGWGVGGKLER